MTNKVASSLKEKTAKGLFWGGISNSAVVVVGALFSIVLARTLSRDDYGLVAMLAIFTAIANTLIDSGFAVALTNKKEIRHDDYNAVFWFTSFVSVGLYLLLFFAAPLIARFYDKPELIPLARFLFLSFIFGGISSVSYTVLFKQLMVKQRAWIDILSVLLSGTTGVILALRGYGYWALVTQTVLYIGSNSVMRFIVAPWKPTLNINFTPLKEMFSFSIKLFLTNIIVQVNKHVFSLITGKLFGAEQLGVYSQGEKWMMMGSNILTGMVGSVAHPILVEIKEDNKRLVNVFRKMLRFAAFISFPVMFGIAFIAKEFVPLVIGDQWLPSIPFLQLLCIVGALWPVWHLYTYVILSYGKSDLFLTGNLLQSVLQISALLIATRWGLFGMAISFVVTYFFSLFFWHYCVHRLTGLKLTEVIKDTFPYLAIVAVIFSIVWFVTLPIAQPWLLLIAKIVLSAGLYIAVLWFSGSVIFRESLEMLLKKKIN